MSTIVYQGLQSCIHETTTLKLKLASPSPSMVEFHHTIDEKLPSNWKFLHTLSNISSSPKETNQENQTSSSYVHLSQESLELCTENLGSENGSDHTMDINILSSSPLENQQKLPTKSQVDDQPRNTYKVMNSHNFPPPLTTLRNSSNSLQITPHRENGRLIIEAIETPPRITCFQAERINGRLRLCFFKKLANEENDDDEYESEIDEEDSFRDDVDDDDKMSRDLEENNFESEDEIEMEKFQRASRCKEGGHGNKGLCHWKPLWVATP